MLLLREHTAGALVGRGRLGGARRHAAPYVAAGAATGNKGKGGAAAEAWGPRRAD